MIDTKKWIELFIDSYRTHATTQNYNSIFLTSIKIHIKLTKTKFVFGYSPNSQPEDDIILDQTIYEKPTDALSSLTTELSGYFIMNMDELAEDPTYKAINYCNLESLQFRDQTQKEQVNIPLNESDILNESIESAKGNIVLQKHKDSMSLINVNDLTVYLKKLPLLMMYVNIYKKKWSLKDYKLLIIQHLLDDFPAFLAALEILGAQKSNIHIVGIPYSSKNHIIHLLTEMKYRVFVPAKYPFEEFVEIAIKEIKESIVSGDKILVIEDGGYSLPYLLKFDTLRNCVGISEQTQNGITRDKEFIRSHEPLLFPIIDIAESRVKKVIESIFVSDAMIRNIKILLMRTGKGIHMKKILIIGYGAIGKELANKFKHENILYVMVYDIDLGLLAEAHARGFVTNDNVIDMVKEADIIIGTTGHTQKPSIDKEVLLEVKNRAILISVSSKNKEIDLEALEELWID